MLNVKIIPCNLLLLEQCFFVEVGQDIAGLMEFLLTYDARGMCASGNRDLGFFKHETEYTFQNLEIKVSPSYYLWMFLVIHMVTWHEKWFSFNLPGAGNIVLIQLRDKSHDADMQ